MDYDAHVQKAVKNSAFESVVNDLDSRYADWALVAMYYTAVHYADAICIKAGAKGRIRSHTERKSLLAKHLPWDLLVRYQTLEDLSRDARYNFVNLDAYGPEQRAKIRHLVLGELRALA